MITSSASKEFCKSIGHSLGARREEDDEHILEGQKSAGERFCEARFRACRICKSKCAAARRLWKLKDDVSDEFARTTGSRKHTRVGKEWRAGQGKMGTEQMRTEARKKRERTYRDETDQTSPNSVVGQLAPTTLVHDVALVNDTTNKIDQQSYAQDDAKHSAGAQSAFFFRLGSTTTGAAGSDLEDIGAMVKGTDKRNCRASG